MVMMTKGIAVALMLPCDSHLCEPSCSAPVLRWPGSVIRESAGRAGTEQEVRSVSYRLHTLLAVGRVARAARPPGGGAIFTPRTKAKQRQTNVSLAGGCDEAIRSQFLTEGG